MPELPEVETTVRGLAHVLDGQILADIRTNRPNLRRPFPPDLAQMLTGATVTGLSRRAKYGLIHTSRRHTMIFHLGMSGRWRINPDEPDRHDHLVLRTARGDILALNDPRRFGSVDLVQEDKLDEWPIFAAMGPEPLGPAFTATYLRHALNGRKNAIKTALLDQRRVAGLGNIYVCEALNRAGIRPDKPAGSLHKKAAEQLVGEIRAVLEEAIAAGGSTIRDYAQPDGKLGYFAKDWHVYGREGEPCPCGGKVERFTQQGRSTFWCRKCQR